MDGFVEKNKDELPPDLKETQLKGENVFTRVFQEKLSDDEVLEEHTANRKEKYIGYKFGLQMASLMEELQSCDCNFMRCIKPNESKSQYTWVQGFALNQLKYFGVLDTINLNLKQYQWKQQFKFSKVDNLSMR